MYEHVRQEHNSGCFVACAAMLSGKSYLSTYQIIHPKRNFNIHGAAIHPLNAIRRLKRLGIEAEYTNDKNLSKLKRDALVCIRWSHMMSRGHAIVFDHKEKRFLDPAYYSPLPISEYQSQLNFILYIIKNKNK